VSASDYGRSRHPALSTARLNRGSAKAVQHRNTLIRRMSAGRPRIDLRPNLILVVFKIASLASFKTWANGGRLRLGGGRQLHS